MLLNKNLFGKKMTEFNILNFNYFNLLTLILKLILNFLIKTICLFLKFFLKILRNHLIQKMIQLNKLMFINFLIKLEDNQAAYKKKIKLIKAKKIQFNQASKEQNKVIGLKIKRKEDQKEMMKMKKILSGLNLIQKRKDQSFLVM